MPAKSQSPPEHTHDANPDHLHLDLENCQCQDTGKCVCALKNDAIDTQSGQSMPPPPSARRPRLFQSQSSEHHMTVFANGHHKPVHRNNNAAHECGVPYRIPNLHPPVVSSKAAGHRSTESLPTLASLDGEVAAPPTPGFFEGTKAERRLSKSEQTSPLLQPFMNTPPSDGPGSSSQPATAPLDLPYLNASFPEEQSVPWINTNFSSQDSDVGLLSATSLGPDMWSWTGNDLPIGSRTRAESDPLSWANGNNSIATQPALTHASSSGPQSEIEDPFGFDDAALAQQLSEPPSTGSQPIATTELNAWENLNISETLNLNEPANNRWSMPSFSGLPASSLTGSNNAFPDHQKDSSSDQMSRSIGHGRPASLRQPSQTYNNNISQPRGSPDYAVPGNPPTQTSLNNSNTSLNSSTNEWLKELGLDYDINESGIFGSPLNNLPFRSGINSSNNMPMANAASINDFDDNDFADTAFLPPAPSASKSTYAQTHGMPSWNNSPTNIGKVSDDWLR